ncbi:POU domain, class 6, transcription factor 1 [Hemicordylus capensis]|uniref:POU domain, class 6, transcription factor 1 n=1 Tax=Hemicordylus capensis TaxID=884348 RepID=UPI0023040919|nr:POU domain, class 6, transcription factor 1 [Hemicordylus capensis]XP_053151128.1 POU domain, class 6, transcription factor 1 [Hemicordylus capensis]XP_053151129.1 POU domain, class 6, transcription factor 1 [Hemicordylus capensis]XP_053151130.1 POU domain, class 6, transcription factor 1 [Hemicordylus capensis]XP_053151132.1 POU domain, class 6, transcription factor 1 [Hemicordylus capensis]XP_053151133.1 POU domain, class 6, transcription factor 1 [Hemicordylus capensis]XP_053151134.1 PO
MDAETVPPQEASLTVNEQVIVMSSHETIRVLEVGVDAPLPVGNEGNNTLKTTMAAGGEAPVSCPPESHETGREGVEQNPEKACGESGGEAKTLPDITPAPVPGVVPFSQVTSQQTQTLTPITVQAAPQVLTQENLATVVTGVMVPAGAVTQPLLIPISIAGQVAGQQGLAVWTFPAATVAALPGLTAASPTGGIFKSPIANLQAAAVLNTAIQAPLQPAQPVQAQPTVQPRPPVPTQTVFQPQTQPALLPQTTTASTPPVAKPLETPAQITVQPAGFAFNPGIISAASLGAQTQLLSSLAATPVIANTIPSVQGITGQILTNAQGQVIGTLPWVVNPTGIATANPVPATLPAQNLQVQAVTPQLLLNAQGQVIATLASSTIQTAAAVRKPSTPESPAKTEVQPIQPAPTMSQPPAVVIASPPPPAAKLASAPVPITCSETPTVSQLVSKPQPPNSGSDEDGINLEEIREFAKNFKIRRLSLGLTQTQVGQALTATEGPAYSQSAICRFEKLDITPKSAQKLKPVLEKWLSEAELRNQEGQQNLMEFVGGEPSKKRKRRTSFTPQAIEALNAYFEKNALPTGQEITEIAKELNYDREVVRVWFCNRRQTLKNTSKLNVFQIP